MLHAVKAFFVFALAAVSPVFADAARVPVEICRGFFFVAVSLRASDEAPDGAPRTLWFLFDTGASRSLVDPDSLERVSGRRIESGQTVILTGASAGPVSVDRLPARVRGLDHLSTALGREIDGILGFNAFSDFLLTLDYPAGEMRLERGALPAPDGVTVFSARGPDARPWMELRLGPHVRRMLVDSGAGGGLAVTGLDRYPTLAPPRPVGASVLFDHFETRTAARLAVDGFLGPHRLELPILEETRGSELIGWAVLRHFAWTFDQRNRRLRVERPDGGEAIHFAPVMRHGLVLKPEGGFLRVEAVLAGSPAAGVDIRAGDMVTHFDGLPVSRRGCDSDAGERMRVTRNREGVAATVEIEMVALVE